MVYKFWQVYILLIFILLGTNSFIANAQDDPKDIFLEAESYFLFEEYNEALPLYAKLLRKNPYNDNLNYRIGVCYLYHDYKKENSINYLEKAAKNISPSHKEGSFKETKAPVDAIFYLGDAYRVNNKPDLAIKYYKKFLALIDDDVYDSEYVKKKIESCENAKILRGRPIDYISTNLGDTINSRFSEYNAVLSSDGKTLAFTRTLQFYDGIFISYLKNGAWTTPYNIISQLGVDGDILTCSLNKNGTELYLYRGDEYDGNIYISRKDGQRWSKIEKLNKNINTKYWESHASISDDGQTLFFTSNRKGGFGELDIYKSAKNENGEWGSAVNLGSNVNTEYNEEAPFISENGNILFFTSDGHVNMGGYDIFYSERKGDSWSTPENFGYPINTADDNLFFAPFDNGKYALVSLFDSDTRGLKDIVKLEVFWKLNPKSSNGIVANAIEAELQKTKQIKISDKYDKTTTNIPDNEKINKDPNQNLTNPKNQLIVEIEEAFAEKSTKENITSKGTFNTEEEFDQNISNDDHTAKENLPMLKVESEEIDVTSNEELNISLSLQKNSSLLIETYNNGKLIKTQTYHIQNENFLLKFTPLAGENVIKLQITDEHNNKNEKEITINYFANPQKKELPQNAKKRDLQVINLNTLFDDIYKYAGKELRKSLEEYKATNNTISSDKLIEHLFETIGKYGYDETDILNMILTASNLKGENIQEFVKKVRSASGYELKDFLTSLSLNEQNIDTPAMLLYYILEKEPLERFTKNDFYEMLANLLVNSYENKDSEISLAPSENQKGFKQRNSILIYTLSGVLMLIFIIWLFVRRKQRK